MTLRSSVLGAALLLWATGCGGTRERPASAPPPYIAEQSRPPLPPDQARVRAVVAEIDTTRQPATPSDPCAQAPCRAKIRVEAVLGRGAAFHHPLSKGTELWVRFAFTLRPTREVLPRNTLQLPGLAEGSVFEANLHARPGLRGETLSVYEYDVR